MHIVWYEIIPNIYNYRKLYICTINNIKSDKFHRIKAVNQRHYRGANILYCIFERDLKGKNIYTIEISYVNDNDAKSNIYK